MLLQLMYKTNYTDVQDYNDEWTQQIEKYYI